MPREPRPPASTTIGRDLRFQVATHWWIELQLCTLLLGSRIAALLCVHGAHVQGGGLHAQGVAIVPAHLLRSALDYNWVLSDADVELLAATAWTRLRPAA